MPGTHPRGDRVQPRQLLSQLTGLFRDGRKMSRDHLRHAAAEGGCLCGALRYRIAPAAELCVYCCHCRDCQRLSSSAFTVSMVRSEEHTSELQSLMRISYAVFCLKKKNKTTANKRNPPTQ